MSSNVMFASDAAREAALKKQKEMDAIAKAKKDAADAEQRRKDQEEHDRLARIEAKRSDFENKFRTGAATKASADEALADALLERAHQREAEKKAQEEADRKAAAAAAAAAKAEADRKARQLADEEAAAHAERERQKDERDRKAREVLRQAEYEAEMRQLATDVMAGRVVLTNTNGVFTAAETGSASSRVVRVDPTAAWVLKHAVVVKVAAPEPPKPVKMVIGAGRAAEASAVKAKPPAFLAGEEKAPRPHMPTLPTARPVRQHNVLEIGLRLQGDQPTQLGALFDLLEFFLKKIKAGGMNALLAEVEGSSRKAFIDTPVPLADILAQAPGNIAALLCLGILAFCGDDAIGQKVAALKAIPTTVDAWIGTVIGAKLYFEYLLWKLAVADMDLRGRMDAKVVGWKPFGNDAPPPTPDVRDQEALFNRTEAATRIIGLLTDAVGGVEREDEAQLMIEFDHFHAMFIAVGNEINSILESDKAELEAKLDATPGAQQLARIKERLEDSTRVFKSSEQNAKITQEDMTTLREQAKECEERAAKAQLGIVNTQKKMMAASNAALEFSLTSMQ